ncbi:hypothetical protein [Clostridium beijerinckii]|uniref:hypothetical protein n=1 Tax=Clostridium beijerinckii TaxID=1520 RepID=UPI00098BDD51|nr:hypothetical protein [Clostridium beijerinckii]NRT79449.1 hypothetical protein [Clostridium beijerinckii]OOM41541.1 hypothetical protein CBEIJ_44710 [Clostridium beijerinckii]
MERYIEISQELCKGVTLNEEFTLDLNEEQVNIAREVAIQCDCIMDDVYLYLVQSKNRKLLLEFFKGDLEKVKEKLIEGIYEEAF